MIFILPIALIASKITVGRLAARAVRSGAEEAGESIRKFVLKRFCYLVVNTLVLIVAVFIIPATSEQETSRYLVCSVYFGSILHGLWEFVRNLPGIWECVIKHRLNLKAFLKEYIYKEARVRVLYEIEQRGFLARKWFSWFGPSPDEVARRIATASVKKAFAMVSTFAVVVVTYVAIFRMIVAPTLVGDATDLSYFGSALYPLLNALDYFLGLRLVAVFE